MAAKVRVGFVGAGWMGGQLFDRLMNNPDAEILGLSEPNRERARQILSKYNLPEGVLVDKYEKLLKNPDINAVFLVSPNTFHGPQSVAALGAGKHVFCEKPCATKYTDFLRQIELEKEKDNLICIIDYIMFFDDMENKLHEMCQKKYFGQITQIQVNYRHPVNIAGDKAWKLRRDIVGDGIGMGPIHSIFTLCWHMQPDAPVGVYAASMEARVRGFEVPPVWNIMIEFESGATGIVQGNIDNGNRYDAYHNIYGTKGGFVFDSQTEDHFKVKYWSEEFTDGEWVYPFNPELTEEKFQWGNIKSPDSGDVIHHQTTECVGHFVDCIVNKKKSPLSFAGARYAAEIAFAAMVSDKLKKRVELPLDEELGKETLSDLV